MHDVFVWDTCALDLKEVVYPKEVLYYYTCTLGRSTDRMVSVRRKLSEGHRHRRCTSESFVAQVHMAEAPQNTQMVTQQAWRPQDLELRHLCQRFAAVASIMTLLALRR